MGSGAPMARGLALGLAVITGCATISTSTRRRVLPAAGPPRTLGPPGTRVVARGYALRYEQRLDTLTLWLEEERRCAAVRYWPVVEEVTWVRKAGPAIYWEYALGGLLAAVGVVGLAAPERVSSSRPTGDGGIEKDTATGLRLGATMGSLGLLLLAAGIADSIRARDRVVHVDALDPRLGPPEPCARPRVPLAHRAVTLVLGEARIEARTDADGRAELRLPPEPPSSDPTPRTIPASVQVTPERAVPIALLVPYGATATRPHRGAHESPLAP